MLVSMSDIGISHTELKRLSTPELASTVRELWQQAYIGYDTRALLLELIYLTPMKGCTDLALEELFDEELPYHHRTYAAWSVLEFGGIGQKQKIGEAVLHRKWPEILVRKIMSFLMPDAITQDEFLNLAQTLKEVPHDVHGLSYELFQGVKSELLTDEQRIYLRDSFTQIIWLNRKDNSRIYQAHSEYDHFIDAIFYSCLATIPSVPKDVKQWAWCLAIAFHFGDRRTSIVARDEIEKVEST